MIRLALLAPLVFAIACAGKPAPNPVPQPPPNIAIDISVSDLDTKAPIEGATVTSRGNDLGTTNQDGYLLVPSVPEGVILPYSVTADGYKPGDFSHTPRGNDIHALAALEKLKDPEPEPLPITIRPLRVRGNGGSPRWFETDQGELADWREVSAFSLLGQVIYEDLGSAGTFIDTWRDLGYNGFRVAASFTLYPRGQVDPERTPGYWEAVHSLTRLAAEKNVRIRWVIFMASEPWGGVWHPDRRDIWSGSVRDGGNAFARRFVSEIRDYPNVILEIANEPAEIGMRDSFDELIDLGREIKNIAPGQLLAAGSPAHEGDQRFTRRPFDYLDSHLPREYVAHESWGSTKRKTDHPQVQPHDQPTPMPFSEGEPTNFDGPIPGRSDYDQSTASAFCAAAVSRLTSSYMTFHYDGGIYGQLPSPQVQELARAFVRGLEAVPQFETYQLWRGHHPESSVRRAPFAPDDDSRVVEEHVNRGNLWRAVGSRNILVGLMEHKDFDIRRYADRPLTTIHREVFGNYACGVYQQ